MRTYVRMEIACVIDRRLAAPEPPGPPGGFRPGRHLSGDSIADPVAAAELTEAMARALEGVGAAVETERAGEAFFAGSGLRGPQGGRGRRGDGDGEGRDRGAGADRGGADPNRRLRRRRAGRAGGAAGAARPLPRR